MHHFIPQTKFQQAQHSSQPQLVQRLNFKSINCLRNKLTQSHICAVFITAYNASGQAYFQSPALKQLQTQILYFSILCGFMSFI